MNSFFKAIISERGDVLMEYVIITLFTILPLVAVGNMLFNPLGVATTDPVSGVTVQFGLVGDVFVSWYQRLVCGLGLPFP